MDVYEDHYEILGLPSGKNGAKITLKEITKAYKAKALLLHPDKNPFDSKAKAKFQRLKSSYDVLKDDNTRKLFDKKLSNIIAKRRKMESDLARVSS
uniref:J domain-containing protein n=1 Tax=Cannabis sativa TaxID=3483 RepID=A0A803P8F8_CANSA